MRQGWWLCLLLAGVAPAAVAAERPYFGVDGVLASIDEPGWGSAQGATAVQFRAGTDFSDWMGVEARAAFGITSASADLAPPATVVLSSLDYTFNHAYSLFLRPKLALGEGAELYALAGMGRVQVAVESSGGVGGNTLIARSNEPGFGLGLLLGRQSNVQLVVDYVMYPEFRDDPRMQDAEIGVLSAGLRFPIR
jgi:opacity protein-like surface antigen